MNNPNPSSAITELLESASCRALTVQSTEVGRGWNYQKVVSPFSRLWLVLDGEAQVEHHGQQFNLKPGALHLVPAFTEHNCNCTGRLRHFHLHFSARLPAGIDVFSVLDCDWQVRAPSGFRNLFKRLEAIYPNRRLPNFNPFQEEYREFSTAPELANEETDPASWLEAQGILRLLLVPFICTARMHSGIHAQVARRFMAVHDYIHRHMSEPIVLADLAKVVGLNPTYFSDRFHEIVGVRPLEYLMRRRIERAQYLLLTTQQPIKEISYAIGIRDPAYFTRAFVKFCGSSPTAYRKSHGIQA